MAKVVAVSVGTIAYEPEVQWQRPGAKQVATVVRVRTDAGIEGVSVTWNDSPAATAMALTIQAWFAAALVGYDVRSHPATTEPLLRRTAWNGTSCVAIAAIDNALWDAKARAANAPLHALLGTRHQALPAYAATRGEGQASQEEIIDRVFAARERGFHAYKLHLWGGWQSDVAGCTAARAALGDSFSLMFDPLGRYTLTEAVSVGQALENLGYLWLEDPIPWEDRLAYRWLAQHLSIPLVATDALQWSWSDYLDAATHRCPVMLRLDAGRQGITFCSKVMELAGHHGVRCEFHAFGPEPNSIAGLHLGLAQRQLSYYEACEPRHEFEVPGIEVPTRLDDRGCVAAPTGPGLGLEIDWPWLEAEINWVRA